MARIRSIHPGLFTDEAFASLSMSARVLLLGIWTESDDHGVFEWKPVTLKMRVMPVDTVDIPALLDELEKADVLKSFVSGKRYGVVRNFCRYQRPKEPNYIHPIPTEFYSYAGLNPDGSLLVLKRSRSTSEKSPQREEGGGNLEEGNGNGEGAKKTARPKPANGDLKETKITVGFQPTPATRQAIAEMGFGDTQFNGEFSKFIAYYLSRGATRADWNAALVSWFQRAKPDGSVPVNLALVGKVLIIEGTLEERCWQQDTRERTGRAMPIIDVKLENGRAARGWYKPTLFPAGYDEATGEKLPPKSDEAAA